MRLTRVEYCVITALLLPFLFALFYRFGAWGMFCMVLIDVLFLLFSLFILLLTKDTRYKKIYYFIAATVIAFVFIQTKDELIDASDSVFFSINRSSMEKVVAAIEENRLGRKNLPVPEFSFAVVDTLEDGEIIFTLDGMLDNCVGIAYVKNNANPGYTNCGRIIYWKKLDEYWYLWYTT